MSNELSIQQVAAHTGLTVHTLRYYERIGLLDNVQRASSGHRRYSEVDIEWIVLLLRLRSTGMPIADVQRFAALVRQGDSTVPQRRALLETHQRRVSAHLAELATALALIDDKVAHYRAKESECEPVL